MRANRGVTLIELIIAIVLIGIVVTAITTALYPQSRQSAQIVHASRAAELGHAVLDEVLSRKFDHNSGELGGLPVCISTNDALKVGEKRCTDPAQLGPDTNAEKADDGRTVFNDIDDYHGLTGKVQDVIGGDLTERYSNFSVAVSVFYDVNRDGTADPQKGDIKRVNVRVTDPAGNRYDFAVYRGNF
ncbi:type IV pilus modification PilV family protein [Photobacterium sp. J15]|uniref:type IV pilus modification PilV family protein n=1 Tax=Photobacterium sp. J15 TaxID=265901 RepID=UPI000A01DB4F|nr:type II secretion system protein [Photobacterium sp. J15]